MFFLQEKLLVKVRFIFSKEEPLKLPNKFLHLYTFFSPIYVIGT